MSKPIHAAVARLAASYGMRVRRVELSAPCCAWAPSYHGCAHPRAAEAFSRLWLAFEYARIARSWLRNGYIADYNPRNRVLQRVSVERPRRGGTVGYVRVVETLTMREATEIATRVIESRHG